MPPRMLRMQLLTNGGITHAQSRYISMQNSPSLHAVGQLGQSAIDYHGLLRVTIPKIVQVCCWLIAGLIEWLSDCILSLIHWLIVRSIRLLISLCLVLCFSYVAWNLHEPSPGVFNFDGILDLRWNCASFVVVKNDIVVKKAPIHSSITTWNASSRRWICVSHPKLERPLFKVRVHYFVLRNCLLCVCVCACVCEFSRELANDYHFNIDCQ